MIRYLRTCREVSAVQEQALREHRGACRATVLGRILERVAT